MNLLRPARVMVADDDLELRRLLVDALVKDGYRVESVSTGLELLFRACQSSFDLIISDVRMPGSSGLEVIATLRSSEHAGWNTPVIVITAFADDETRAEAERLGAVLFEKPFDVDDLRTCAVNLVPPDQEGRTQGA